MSSLQSTVRNQGNHNHGARATPPGDFDHDYTVSPRLKSARGVWPPETAELPLATTLGEGSLTIPRQPYVRLSSGYMPCYLDTYIHIYKRETEQKKHDANPWVSYFFYIGHRNSICCTPYQWTSFRAGQQSHIHSNLAWTGFIGHPVVFWKRTPPGRFGGVRKAVGGLL
jgi:hypothetical protein